MLNLKKCYKSLQSQYKELLFELWVKLDKIYENKLEYSTEANIENFTKFVKDVWELLGKCLEDDVRNEVFYSYNRGILFSLLIITISSSTIFQ